MDNSRESQKIMAQQLKYSKLQCYFSAAAAVCGVILLIAVLSLVPALQGVLTDLEALTSELAALDMAEMVESVNALAADSQQAVGQAAEKIEAIDIEALNRAIKNLSDVIEPLANFFNIFN